MDGAPYIRLRQGGGPTFEVLGPIKDWDPRDNDIHNAGPAHLIAIS